MGRTAWHSVALIAAVAGLVLAVAPPAFAAFPPHVPQGPDPDGCAICHRGHTASGGVTWSSQGATHTALTVGSGQAEDTGLCFSCHGLGSLGAAVEIESSFAATSSHSLSPAPSRYAGQPAKNCSACHDSHGTERTSGGTPFPALLRVGESASAPHTGEAVCVRCHPTARPGNLWDGLAVYKDTAHYSAMATPTTGTDIRCSICHDSHGSSVAPMLRTEIAPPGAPSTYTVTANDRTFCLGCHTAPAATWTGPAPYGVSGHGSSAATIAVDGEYIGKPAGGRRVGECQSCHAAMGRSDGKGGALPKLAAARGRALCDDCHRTGGVASSDIATLAFPAASASASELAVVWSGEQRFAAQGRTQIYTQTANGSVPTTLEGPREYAAGPVSGGAAGDLDGDGVNEFVVGQRDTARLTVLRADAARGLAAAEQTVAAPADLVAVGDIIPDGTGLPEVAVVSRAAAQLRLYRMVSGSLVLVAGPVALSQGPTGIAVGDVTGTGSSDVVITASAGTPVGRVDIATEDGAGSVVLGGFACLRTGPPVAPVVGDVRVGGAKDEIVVGSGGTQFVSVYDATGNELTSFGLGAGFVTGATAIGDVDWAVAPTGSGLELVVGRTDAAGNDGIRVYRQNGAGDFDADAAAPATAGTLRSVAIGDVDGDAKPEVVLAAAGSPVTGTAFSAASLPSIQVFDTDGTGLVATPRTLAAGGRELAGGEPVALVADLGGVGASRHPVDVGFDSHTSTEVATPGDPLPLHVTCADCHNVHEATSSPGATPTAAPAAFGRIFGAPGVDIDFGAGSFTRIAEVADEYQLCLKCHSAWAGRTGDENVAAQISPNNTSFHAVVATATDSVAPAGTFVAGWNNDSKMYCVTCHGNGASGARGPHRSPNSPILVAPATGTTVDRDGMLCYRCHTAAVYQPGSLADSTSRFHNSVAGNGAVGSGHRLHSNIGIDCASCHVTHGGSPAHLMRTDAGYTATASGGSCTNACHVTGGATHTYQR